MVLVDYPDSPDEDADTVPSSKKRKASQIMASSTPLRAWGTTTLTPASKQRKTAAKELPPLPSAFRDLYSSTVRASTQDDPALHNGRKRIVPHVDGNWPTHVYIEWVPNQVQHDAMSEIVMTAQQRSPQTEIHSLLANELGVAQPLHISLSRPMVMKTEEKTDFLIRYKTAVAASRVQALEIKLNGLSWHPNEDSTRWFLVIYVSTPHDELVSLLDFCNAIAFQYGQPLLYEDETTFKRSPVPFSEHNAPQHGLSRRNCASKFHFSIAWSLVPPTIMDNSSGCNVRELTEVNELNGSCIRAHEVKIRIGQDVTTASLDQ